MKLKQCCLIVVLAAWFVAAKSSRGNDPQERVSVKSLIQESGALEDVSRGQAVEFRENLESIIKLRVDQSGLERTFRRESPFWEPAVQLVQFLVLREHDMASAWLSISIIHALPREVSAEALARLIDQAKEFSSYEQPNDFARYVYAQDHPDARADCTVMIDRMHAATEEQRNKRIAHMLAYAPSEAFRALLELERNTFDHLSELSWLDRGMQEARWRGQHNVSVSPELKNELKRDLEFAVKHDTWWVRLYAVELMLDSPYLRDSEYLGSLADDPHPVVRSRFQKLLLDKSD